MMFRMIAMINERLAVINPMAWAAMLIAETLAL